MGEGGASLGCSCFWGLSSPVRPLLLKPLAGERSSALGWGCWAGVFSCTVAGAEEIRTRLAEAVLPNKPATSLPAPAHCSGDST